jgi:hypothetical protein
MPTVNNPTLNLTTVNQNVSISVTCSVRFTEFERKLSGLGLRYRSRVLVRGMDPGSSQVLAIFPATTIPVTSGDGPQIVPFSQAITRTRASLQEDEGLGDDDEIRCSISINAVGMPPEFTLPVLTNERILFG